MTAKVIYGVDFRKHLDKRESKSETFEQMAARIFDHIELPDTAPSEYNPENVGDSGDAA